MRSRFGRDGGSRREIPRGAAEIKTAFEHIFHLTFRENQQERYFRDEQTPYDRGSSSYLHEQNRITDNLLSKVPNKTVVYYSALVERFAGWMSYLAYESRGVPCIRNEEGDLIPVDAEGSLPTIYSRLDFNESVESLIDRLNSIAREDGLETGTLDFDDARHNVISDISMAAFEIKEETEEFSSTPKFSSYISRRAPGLDVTVNTKQINEPVYYSNASIFTHRQRFGGSLSSPVRSHLHPGRYIFGVGHNGVVKYDMDEFKIPPILNIHLGV